MRRGYLKRFVQFRGRPARLQYLRQDISILEEIIFDIYRSHTTLISYRHESKHTCIGTNYMHSIQFCVGEEYG